MFLFVKQSVENQKRIPMPKQYYIKESENVRENIYKIDQEKVVNMLHKLI